MQSLVIILVNSDIKVSHITNSAIDLLDLNDDEVIIRRDVLDVDILGIFIGLEDDAAIDVNIPIWDIYSDTH